MKLIRITAAVTLAVAAVACGSSSDGPATPTAPTTPAVTTPAPAPSTPTVPPAAAANIETTVGKAISNAFLAMARGLATSLTTLSNPSGRVRALSTVNVPIDATSPCSGGGLVHVVGGFSGSVPDTPNGSGVLLLNMNITFGDLNSCIENGVNLSGDPYLSMSGQFSFLNGLPSTQSVIRLNGGFKFTGAGLPNGSVQFNCSDNFNWQTGAITSSGTVTWTPPLPAGSAGAVCADW